MQRPPAGPRSNPPENYSSFSGPWREWHEKHAARAAQEERDLAEDETVLSSPLGREPELRPEEMTQLMPNAPPRPLGAPTSAPPLSPPVPYVAAPTQGWPSASVQPLPMPSPMHAFTPPGPMPGSGSTPAAHPYLPAGYHAQQPMPTIPPQGYSSSPPAPAFGSVAQPSGLPSGVAFALGIVAVLVALLFDVIFLKVHIPGVGGYAWYLTTALSFAGAGYGGAKWTRASQATAYTAVAMAGVLYGLADVGLGLVLEGLPMGGALFLGIQGVVIAVVSGGAGVRKGMAEADD